MVSFHSQNVPIIEDNMKIAEIVLTNNKTTNPNWSYMGFVTDDATLPEIVMAYINGEIQGVRVVCRDDAHASTNAIQITGFPIISMDSDNQSLQFGMKDFGFLTDDSTESLQNFKIYADGDKEMTIR